MVISKPRKKSSPWSAFICFYASGVASGGGLLQHMDTDGQSDLMGALSGVLCFLTLESGGMNVLSIFKRASIKDLLLKWRRQHMRLAPGPLTGA